MLEEVSFKEAHQVGIELCEKILEGKYEYVLATHIDKDHIHNHIIFNSIDVDDGKVYHSYYGSYMDIGNQSDRLCKKHNSLSAQYEELEHLKVNMDDYLGRKKTKKKESVISTIRKHQSEDRENPKEKNKISKEAER